MAEIARESLDQFDFTLGLLNAVDEANPGFRIISGDRRLDKAFEDASKRLLTLVDIGEVAGIDVQIQFGTDHIHGNSTELFKTMCYLVEAGYVSPIKSTGQHKFNRKGAENAEAFHAQRRIPGDINLYRKLAARFISLASGNET